MNKKLITIFCLLIAAIAWAGEHGKSSMSANTGDKGSISTDLGKGLPYPGLSTQEKAKLEEISNTKQPSQPNTSNHDLNKLDNSKPAPVPPPSVSSKNPLGISHSKPERLSTDIGKGLPYPGLSPQEREKLRSEGGK